MNRAQHILTKFGKGITDAARALGYPIPTVQYWWNKGKIPEARWDGIIEKGDELGILIQKTDFLFDPEHSDPLTASSCSAGANNAGRA